MNIFLLKKAPGYNILSSEASVTCVRWGSVIQRYDRDAILVPFCFHRILPNSIHTDSNNMVKITSAFGSSKSGSCNWLS